MSPARYYKFLEAGGVCPIAGAPFPLPEADAPGAWLHAGGALDPDGLGFLVYGARDLAPFACAELYEVEVAAALRPSGDAVVAERVRLVRRVAQWPDWARELVAASVARARALAETSARVDEYIADVNMCAEYGMTQGVLFVSAKARAHAVDREGHDAAAQADAFTAERAWQSAFIAERLAGLARDARAQSGTV